MLNQNIDHCIEHDTHRMQNDKYRKIYRSKKTENDYVVSARERERNLTEPNDVY